MARLEGRVAIVTGAAQGIGAAYAKALAGEGARVVVADILDPGATVGIIRQAGGEALGIETDVTSDAALSEMAAKTLAEYGRIDVAVANAAQFGHLTHKSFLDIDLDEFDSVMRVNVRGVFQTVKAVAPAMIERGYGKIVTVASGTVFKGTPHMLHYVSSKGAIVAMTKVLARELGPHNICVNAIAPGLTMSEAVRAQVAEGRMADPGPNIKSRAFQRDELPEDLTGTVVFLASPESDFMTGQTLAVDGGSVMH